uniref:Glycosyltransferase n=1 Tax=Picea sitchensis TaxID=3332 RepID=D5A9K7_PICSI|nr:unknown [Picea sitchensis]ADE76673.1 unknown [Picea sitchensis]
MECEGKTGIHAIIVPMPGQGHINPAMQLAKKLASKGIAITFVLTQSWHNIITHAHSSAGVNAFAHARNLGLDIRLVAIPDCLPGEFERWNKLHEFFQSLDNMESHVEELIKNLNQSNPTPVSCIVADTMLGWAVPLAKKLRLLSVSFWTQNVSVFSITYHSYLAERQAGSVIHIPGVTHLQPADLPLWLKLSPDDVIARVVARCFQTVREADWVVANSFQGLEGHVVEALWEKMRVYCVGPLLPSAYLDLSDPRDSVVGTSYRVEMDCTQWLDDKAPKSVIYVSFGSLLPMSITQIEEIAMGLKESDYNFIWVLRRPSNECAEVSSMLPYGFLNETKQRGLVVPWCSQLKVLSHPSIGGFFSHCGWNSTLESIAFGLPMLGFPLGIEQFANCKLIADEWKIGLRLRSGDDTNGVIGRNEIAENVRRLMEGEEMRRAAERLRDVVKMEVRKGGTSDSNLESVADGLKAKLIENKI